MTLEQINKELIYSKDFTADENFVAIAVEVNKEGFAHHSGILIFYEDNIYLLEFDATNVSLGGEVNEWYFHKPLSLIPSEFVGSFLAYCHKIKDNASPTFGMVYGGSIYDENGFFFSEQNIPEVMSCVGFCLNVILGFLEADEYFHYQDWNLDTVSKPQLQTLNVSENVAENYSNSDAKATLANIRRIKPSELLTSAFLGNNLPIRKMAIDELIEHVEGLLIEKVNNGTIQK